ncbi:MAG: DegV family protein [Oscillospiraceae bacterium]
MKIAIATDTNSGITRDMVQKPGLYLLPMPVIIDGQVYAEGVDIDNRRLYGAMKLHKSLSSSQPSPGQLMDLWDGILEDGYDQVVYIPMSSGLSGSCFTASQLASDYDGRVQVVDNHRISVTQAESFFSAYRLAQQGRSAGEIKAYLEERAYDASIYITVESLEYLKKGGRITPAVAAFATALNLKPVLEIQGDKLDTFAKARGTRQAEATMIEAVKRDRATRFGDVPDAALQIETAGTFESDAQAQRWRALVQAEFPAAAVSYVDLPCSIACHVGMNAAGIGIIKKEVL